MTEASYEHSSWVLGGMIVYMAFMLAIGWYASRRIESTEDFTVAGRGLGLFLCSATFFATWFGAETCMGAAGNAYLYGNQGVVFEPWSAALCLVFAGLLFSPLMRRGRFTTPVDLMERRYSKKMGLFTTLVLTLSDAGWLGGLLVGFGTVIHYFAGVPLEAGIVVATLVVVSYTFMGGLWAVALSDAIQGTILILGIIVLFFVIVPQVDMGMIFSDDPANNWSGLEHWSWFPTSEAKANPEYDNAGFYFYKGYIGWFYCIAAWLSIGFGALPTQGLMQRAMAAKSERTAAAASLIAAFMYIVIGLTVILIGMMYFQLNPDLPFKDAQNKTLLLAAVEYLHPVAATVFVIALVSAIMSSSDSLFMALATLLGHNGYRYFRPDADDRQVLRVVRALVPISGVVALILALYFQAILMLPVASVTLILVGLFVPFAGGLLWKRANSSGAVASISGGIISWIVGFLAYLPMTKRANVGTVEEGVVHFESAMWDAVYISSTIALFVSVVLMVVVSLATQKSDPPKPLTDAHGEKMSSRGFLVLLQKR